MTSALHEKGIVTGGLALLGDESGHHGHIVTRAHREKRSTDRIGAFSDSVIAVVIPIMVLVGASARAKLSACNPCTATADLHSERRVILHGVLKRRFQA